MPKTPPAHHQSREQDQARFNRETVDAISFMLRRVGIDYDIQTLTIGLTPTKIPHVLGRRWTGWQVIDRTNNAGVTRVAPPAGIDPAFELWLQATVSGTFKIMVF